MNLKTLTTALLLSFLVFVTNGQNNNSSVSNDQLTGSGNTDRLNTITTAVPFLIIAPDARGSGMGDVGAATEPDASSMYWNMAKSAFSEEDMSFSFSYTPWLRKLVPDINLAYLNGYKKINDRVSVGLGMRYFTLGDIQFTDQFGNDIRQFRPNEFAISAGVGAKLSKNLSGGFNFRYINSNLTGGVTVLGANTQPGQTVAADLSLYYVQPNAEILNQQAEWALGMNISNIGGKIAYSSTTNTDFLPTNLRLGPRVSFDLDKYNRITIAADVNKLLVPSPPIYKRDSTGSPIPDGEGFEIGAGADPNRSVISGMFGSFNDAPGTPVVDQQGNFETDEEGNYVVENGSVFREEMREVNFGLGLEYWYDKQFAVRGGYFWEHRLKGNRKYFNVGLGLRYNFIGIDMSYLIPAYFGNNFQQSPLANTLRFSLVLNIAEMGGGGDGEGS